MHTEPGPGTTAERGAPNRLIREPRGILERHKIENSGEFLEPAARRELMDVQYRNRYKISTGYVDLTWT